MIAIGFVRGLLYGWPTAHVPDPAPAGLATSVGIVVLLRAFASGCSALTGVEAISNGVHGLPAPAGAQRGQHADVDGRDRDRALPGRVDPRLESRRAAERVRLGALGDRAGRVPARRLVVRLLRGTGDHRRRAGARGQHRVPGLPAPRCAARERQLPATPVLESRRPARLLQRHPRARAGGRRADRRLPRRRQQPHPPLPAGCVHRLHAVAVRNGQAPLEAARSRVARARRCPTRSASMRRAACSPGWSARS